MRKTIITCDHCNKEINIDYITIKVRGVDIDQELELCSTCAMQFRTYTMKFIKSKTSV